MNDMEEVIQAICIATVVATFLLNTGRVLKAIDLCKESLILLQKLVLSDEKQLNIGYFLVYSTMFKAYRGMSDQTNAITYGRRLLAIDRDLGWTLQEGWLSMELAEMYRLQNKYVEARELYERTIGIMSKTSNKNAEADACVNLGIVFRYVGEYDKAREYLQRALKIYKEVGDRGGEASCYGSLGTVLKSLGEYVKAETYLEKALAITIEIGDRAREAASYVNLGIVLRCLGEYDKAKKYLEKAFPISVEIGDREREAGAYGNLGTVFQSVHEYDKAKEYYEKALVIKIEDGDKDGVASCYANLGGSFKTIGEYLKAKEYFEKAILITIEIGDKAGQASSFVNLGVVLKTLGEYDKAKEYFKKALAITTEIGDRAGKASCYRNLATQFASTGENDKAKEYIKKALAIEIEIGDRKGEADCHETLGTVFQSLGEYDKAKECLEKALAITTEIGDRGGVASCCRYLGIVLNSLGEYDKAKKYLDKALAITIDIGNRVDEAVCYGALGTVFKTLGEYYKAIEYHEKALAIATEIGDRGVEVAVNGNLGNVFIQLGKPADAIKCIEKSLAIATKIGLRNAEAACYGYLGGVFENLGDYVKAEEYNKKALTIKIEIGDRAGEAADYNHLGFIFICRKEFVKAEEYLEKALSITTSIGDVRLECVSYHNLALMKIAQKKKHEAFSYLFKSIDKSEKVRGFLKDNDEFKILYSDNQHFPYKMLSRLFCDEENPNKALYVEELGRARALADLMATQYSVERQISANPKSWIGIENIMKKEKNCTCLYLSCYIQDVFLWTLKTSGVICFRRNTVNVGARLISSLDDSFAKRCRSFLSQKDCEDRSLYDIELKPKFSQEEIIPDLRLIEEDNNDDDDIQDREPSFHLLYEMIIAPVADLLAEPEIIIVPERSLYQVPFAALTDESGKYLSEMYRFRIVPSLTTLELILDSPADYHCQTGALIVGDPEVGQVVLKGCHRTFEPLPFARKEAEMIGQLLGVQPLLGQHATKQAVLQKINSASLIHFAAHGSAERGEIALAPACATAGIPEEEDYLLTMSDISQGRLRGKLVVLSCCHSARGQIRAEGVIGIARAFLGSGARSVMVALWAIEDRATEQLMRHFYKHLVRGESASESLYEAMKWMRDNGFAEVCQWAPFVLIGDNVTFDFGTSP